MTRFYALRDGQPVRVGAHEWATWFETSAQERVVARDEVRKDVSVSTVFLGIDHSFTAGDAPVLWETMVFGGTYDELQRRYTSREDAVNGHAEILRRVRAVDEPGLFDESES